MKHLLEKRRRVLAARAALAVNVRDRAEILFIA